VAAMSSPWGRRRRAPPPRLMETSDFPDVGISISAELRLLASLPAIN
jgi:hypothetical protein